MGHFHIKRNDLLDPIETTLRDAAGVVNLTGATVRFKMRRDDATTLKVNGLATVVTPLAGLVRYDWATGDTDTAGEYLAEWEVQWGSNLPKTFPNDDHDRVTVFPDLP